MPSSQSATPGGHVFVNDSTIIGNAIGVSGFGFTITSLTNTSVLNSSTSSFHANDAEQPDGIGLGLAYVKAVAARHKGHVGVVSELGRGAAFTLRLPLFQSTHDD